jgi:hypothetical protein
VGRVIATVVTDVEHLRPDGEPLKIPLGFSQMGLGQLRPAVSETH